MVLLILIRNTPTENVGYLSGQVVAVAHKLRNSLSVPMLTFSIPLLSIVLRSQYLTNYFIVKAGATCFSTLAGPCWNVFFFRIFWCCFHMNDPSNTLDSASNLKLKFLRIDDLSRCDLYLLHMTKSMCIAVQLSKFFFHNSQLHNERLLDKSQNPREIRTCSLPIARHTCWP